jgi:UDP-glucuronate 4-epimerase
MSENNIWHRTIKSVAFSDTFINEKLIPWGMETVLVTGGAGFIGSHVCETLLSKENKVICVDNFNDYYDPKTKEKNISGFKDNPNFILYRQDITDYEGLKEVFKLNNVDKIVHLAARAGVRASFENPGLYWGVNVDGTRNMLEFATEFKIKNFIFGSSSSVYGTNKKIPFSEDDHIENIISPYANTKKKAEELCNEFHDNFDLNVTCLRFFTVYGPRGRPDMAPYKFTELILGGGPIDMYGDGTSKRDYTYVKDIVDGILLSLDKNLGFEIINLGNSNTVELRKFISVIEGAIGNKVKINQLLMQEGDVPLTYADISKAKRLFGYDPKIKIEEGIRLFVEWYKNER